MADTTFPLKSSSDSFPIYGKQSGMMGWSTVSTGKLVSCPECKRPSMYLHQYKRYEEKYCCITCFPKFK